MAKKSPSLTGILLGSMLLGCSSGADPASENSAGAAGCPAGTTCIPGTGGNAWDGTAGGPVAGTAGVVTAGGRPNDGGTGALGNGGASVGGMGNGGLAGSPPVWGGSAGSPPNNGGSAGSPPNLGGSPPQLGGAAGTAPGLGGSAGNPLGGSAGDFNQGGNPGHGGNDVGGVPGVGGDLVGGSGGLGVGGGAGGTDPLGGTAGTNPVGGAAGSTSTQAITSATAQSMLAAEYQSWWTDLFRDCGDGSGCVVDGSRCVSEGIGYGMVLAVNMDDRDTFDKLWNYYRNHLDANGLMHWQTDACGSVTGQNAAADAEMDAAMALIQAEARWGGYAAEATQLITDIKDHETEVCGDQIILRPGDAWGGCSDGNTVNPSYFSPGYYRVFASFVPDQAAHWTQMAADTYPLYATYQAAKEGLICGWAKLDAGCTSEFDWDGVRAPWRVATDYAWFQGTDAQGVLSQISAYVDSHGGIAGVSFDPNSAFRGSLALSGIATTQEKFDTYVTDWLASATQDDPYFQATLRVLFLMLAAGQFPSTL